MINEMPCGYGTVRTAAVRIEHQVSCRVCAEVLAVLEVDCRPAYWSPQLQNLTILIAKFRSILNTPPLLQMHSGARHNAQGESESTSQSARGGWEHLEVHRSTAEGYRSVWVVCIWLPDRINSADSRFDFCLGRINPGTFGTALTSPSSGHSRS